MRLQSRFGLPIHFSEYGCRFRRSMQRPSGRLIWRYVSSGPILWGCSSLLLKQEAFFFGLVLADGS